MEDTTIFYNRKINIKSFVDAPVLSRIDSGKIIVSLKRECAYPNIPLKDELAFVEGMGVSSVDVLLRPLRQDDDDDVGAIVLLKLKDDTISNLVETINALNAHPCVVLAEPDYITDSHIVPNDQYFSYLWGLESIDSAGAWNIATGNDRILVGVVDSGIDYYHPDLMPNINRALDERSFLADSNDSASISGHKNLKTAALPELLELSAMDITGHGTHVAGTIGAVGNNYIGVSGVCWHVGLVSLKIGNAFMDLAAAIKAIDYANRNKIQILNNSWGGWFHSEQLEYAIEHYDGLFVASAGNAGSDNDIFPVYPASFSCPNILSVAASDSNNNLASFSNYGKASVDIAAPGINILSTDIMSRYSYMDGTSMAAPLVSGAAALLKSHKPNLTPLELKEIILLTAEKHAPLTENLLSGGILNIRKMIEYI